MGFHSSFYRSLPLLHVLVATAELLCSFTLLVLFSSYPTIFFKNSQDETSETSLFEGSLGIATTVLFVIGLLRTILIFLILGNFLCFNISCFCVLFSKHYRQRCYALCCSKAFQRFLTFNCNCPCYRARPKLRFRLQLIFLIFMTCMRLVTIILGFTANILVTKTEAVIILISFPFLILTFLLDFYHFRMWWHYTPAIDQQDSKTLSKKHKRYLPHYLLGVNRTGQHGDKLCKEDTACTNRKLEHIVMFHLSEYQPQPRWAELKRLNPAIDTYIGFASIH
ncbi:unnamed protein product [Didymodactylos carnosus]|uniref:Uncharacterized protein n=1 Tax=Didymodactylos carnosus TaxID=1234261 RepID=A0A814IDS1_9BILA|nr:unnamed protein product [Didymodactylos carnosus]CAF1022176.1 unnamed protein product [Didymodactylos carnosus]CAF3784678.1 unnamed protein product [Didymodactylos carnosus]CAF3793604.1 unnamed protein product [Didymodactylos carnosus]